MSEAMDNKGEPLLEVRDLRVRIERDTGVVRPLNGVSFRIHEGQSVGIVGESGCGKTMASNALLRILPRRAQITAGSDRKSTRLNSSHVVISYAVVCLKKKNKHHSHMHHHT